VIDSSDTVRAADTDPDYMVRPEPTETVRVLEGSEGWRKLVTLLRAIAVFRRVEGYSRLYEDTDEIQPR
jgi:hypothetical protein